MLPQAHLPTPPTSPTHRAAGSSEILPCSISDFWPLTLAAPAISGAYDTAGE